MRSTWRSRNAGPTVSFIIATGAVNIRVTRSASAARKWASCPRWVRSAMRTTTPWPRASSPRSRANCWIVVASRPMPRPGIAIFEWLEGWYNPHRRHSSLGHMSPINYERRQLTQTAAYLEGKNPSTKAGQVHLGGNHSSGRAINDAGQVTGVARQPMGSSRLPVGWHQNGGSRHAGGRSEPRPSTTRGR